MNREAYDEMATAQRSHWWFAARRRILAGELRALGIGAGARILEVGSGTGANLELLSEFGHVDGLEMEPEAIAYAQRVIPDARGVALYQGRCPDDLASLQGPYDLICILDVLEHLDDDSRSLSELARLLAPGGRVLITVPAYAWMWAPHDEHLHHRRRYTQRSLRQACERAGLRVARSSYFNTLLFPLALFSRLMERMTRRRSRANETPAATLNAALFQTFSLERHLLAHMRLPFGLSLLMVAQPQQP